MLYRIEITTALYVTAESAYDAEQLAMANIDQATDPNPTTTAVVDWADVPDFDCEASVIGGGTVADWFEKQTHETMKEATNG